MLSLWVAHFVPGNKIPAGYTKLDDMIQDADDAWHAATRRGPGLYRVTYNGGTVFTIRLFPVVRKYLPGRKLDRSFLLPSTLN